MFSKRILIKSFNRYKPVPVAAHAQMSLPIRATGTVDAWIGVGWLKPKSFMALN